MFHQELNPTTFKMTIVDPQSSQENTYTLPLNNMYCPALFSHTATQKLKLMNNTNREDRIAKSIEWEVLDACTSLIAYQRIAKPSGNESELVEIALNKASNVMQGDMTVEVQYKEGFKY
jgi:alcohol dehydrogenase YqhD (iron-dependent ADH family)